MDKYLCRKDVYDILEKAMRDRSHLTQKKITDKNGHQRTVWVKPGEEPAKENKKAPERDDAKKTKLVSHYNDLIQKVSEGPDTKTALMVPGKGFMDKKSALEYLNGKLKEVGGSTSEESSKKSEKDEINFEKKNNYSKAEENQRKNAAEDNSGKAINLSDKEKNEIAETLKDEKLAEAIKKYGNNDPLTIGNMVLNNLNSIGKKELFKKIRNQEWDYKSKNNQHGKTFNSDYAQQAMYEVYKDYEKKQKIEELKNMDWDSFLS